MARYAARGKNYLVLLRPFQEGLIMQQLRYADELRSFDEVPVGEAKINKAELDLARQLVEQSTAERFDPTPYRDEVREKVVELIDRKVQGEEIVAPPEESPKAQVIDLMEALKASLGRESESAGKAGRAGKRPKRAASKSEAKAPRAKKGAGK